MAKATNNAPKATTNETTEVTVDGKKIQVPTDEAMREQGMESLSSRIRHLNSMGVTRGDISRIVKRANGEHPLYQHVRNVLMTKLKSDTQEGE